MLENRHSREGSREPKPRKTEANGGDKQLNWTDTGDTKNGQEGRPIVPMDIGEESVHLC